MANPLYEMLSGTGGAPSGASPVSSPQPQISGGIQFANPAQRMQYILQAMRNPAAFVRQQIPDIPAEISNNPVQILNWMQQHKGVSEQQIHQAQQMANQIQGQGVVR